MTPLDFSNYATLNEAEQGDARQALADSLISAAANMPAKDWENVFSRAGIVPSPEPPA